MRKFWLQAVTAGIGALLGFWMLYYLLYRVLFLPLELGRFLLFAGIGLTLSSFLIGFRVHRVRYRRNLSTGRGLEYFFENKVLLFMVFFSWMFSGWAWFLSGFGMPLRWFFLVLGTSMIVLSHVRIDKRILKINV